MALEMISYKRKEELLDADVTLNGEPAQIVGIRLHFPVVRSRITKAEFAWQTVDHIVKNKNGEFKA